MNRKFTNRIRYIMDELLPPFIRKSYWFMYPVYYFLFKGKNVKKIMDFKSLAKILPENELNELYKEVDVVSRNRKTDLAESNIKFILDQLKDGESVLDVGCSKGYLLNRIRELYPNSPLTGFDLENQLEFKGIEFTAGTITALPFRDDYYDIVLCTHTIEHIVQLDKAIQELIRVTRKKLIIVTPCQKYFYYTLDGHVNFFYTREALLSRFPFKSFICRKLDMDWVYVGIKPVSG